MKIKETIERDCCHNQDLKVYQGIHIDGYPAHLKLWFCVHCGQMHDIQKDDYDNLCYVKTRLKWNL